MAARAEAGAHDLLISHARADKLVVVGLPEIELPLRLSARRDPSAPLFWKGSRQWVNHWSIHFVATRPDGRADGDPQGVCLGAGFAHRPDGPPEGSPHHPPPPHMGKGEERAEWVYQDHGETVGRENRERQPGGRGQKNIPFPHEPPSSPVHPLHDVSMNLVKIDHVREVQAGSPQYIRPTPLEGRDRF